jgi:hypothetical protein
MVAAGLEPSKFRYSHRGLREKVKDHLYNALAGKTYRASNLRMLRLRGNINDQTSQYSDSEGTSRFRKPDNHIIQPSLIQFTYTASEDCDSFIRSERTNSS